MNKAKNMTQVARLIKARDGSVGMEHGGATMSDTDTNRLSRAQGGNGRLTLTRQSHRAERERRKEGWRG